VGPQEPTYQCGALLHEPGLLRVPGVFEKAVDIELSRYRPVNQNGHDDFRFRLLHSHQISCIVAHIVDRHRLPEAGRRATQALIQRNPYVRRENAGMRPQQKIVGIGWIRQIESNPVVADQFIVQPIGNQLHHLVSSAFGAGDLFEFQQKFLMSLHPLLVANRPIWP